LRDRVHERVRDTTLADEIFEHWRNSALTHGAALKATTKTWTAKALELDALQRRLHSLSGAGAQSFAVLEVGCGNGINCLELARSFPEWTFDGVDYVPEMVAAAEESRARSASPSSLRFLVGDAVEVDRVDGLRAEYDVVFTDRCLINLATTALQMQAIDAISKKIRPGGHLVMIENSLPTYTDQNRYRVDLGLPARTPAVFNHFFEEAEMLPHLGESHLTLVDVEDFISLHDLVLYVLVPSINGGEVDYEHPLVEAATKLSIAASAERTSPFGRAGQNRLYCCQKSP
jgi:SAM-dependent methyltransferase